MTGISLARHAARSAVTLALALALTRPAGAQRVHGALRDTTSAQPVLGAVVTLLDSAGAPLARTITDERGMYSLPLGVGQRRVRALRIGYQPRELAVVRASEDVTLDFAMTRIPTMLSGVKVSGRPLCPGSGDRGGSLAFSLWEQARAGLLASVVAREAKPADVRMLSYRRTLNVYDERVRMQTQKRQEGKSTRPFLAVAEPSVFARSGYMKEEHSDRTYFAPDADVMLDESFAVTHCFSLTLDRNHPAQVGIAFEPAGGSGRDTLVDVKGVLWLDRDQPELRTLEFEYTGLEPVASTVNTGGILSFRTMRNGIVLIDWWSLRFPVMVESKSPTSVATPYSSVGSELRADRRNLRVQELQQAGGELLAASWPDGTLLAREPGRIAGRVVEKGTGKPRPGVVVSLVGTYEETKTDSSGTFVFTPVIPGKYTLAASDTMLSDLADARSASRIVDVARGDTAVVELKVPPLSEAIARACQGMTMQEQTSILIGTLLDSAGAPMRGVAVSARWLDVARISGATMEVHHTERTYQPDDAGRFRFCGVVREHTVAVKVVRPDGIAIADTTLVAYDPVVRWTWRVKPKR